MKYVICVNTSFSISLTYGKVYKVMNVKNGFIRVKNDWENIVEYAKFRFKPLKDNKINNLLYKDL